VVMGASVAHALDGARWRRPHSVDVAAAIHRMIR